MAKSNSFRLFVLNAVKVVTKRSTSSWCPVPKDPQMTGSNIQGLPRGSSAPRERLTVGSWVLSTNWVSRPAQLVCLLMHLIVPWSPALVLVAEDAEAGATLAVAVGTVVAVVAGSGLQDYAVESVVVHPCDGFADQE